jgi:hypothetical protein
LPTAPIVETITLAVSPATRSLLVLVIHALLYRYPSAVLAAFDKQVTRLHVLPDTAFGKFPDVGCIDDDLHEEGGALEAHCRQRIV